MSASLIILEWFDAHPARYWTLAWTCFGLLTVVAIGPLVANFLGNGWENKFRRFWPRWLFLVLFFAAFVAFRWPLFMVREELNPDESQLIAGAITLQSDPVYWRSVDGTTHGPLDTYPLLFPRLLGQPISYGSTRVIGSLMLIAAVLSLYFALSAYFGEALGRVGCLPAFCFFAFNTFWDFVHYSSEHGPLCLLALGAMLLALGFNESARRKPFSWQWFGGGLALGAVPLAKLQGAPMAAALVGTALVIELCSPGLRMIDRFRRIGILLVAVTAVPAFFALVTWSTGQGEYAWRSYVLQNLRYTGDRHFSHAEMIRHFWDYARIGTGFYAFASGTTAFIAATLLRAPTFTRASLRLLALGGVFLVSSLVAVLAPGRQYAHYLILLVVPATLFAACLLGAWLEQSVRDISGRTTLRWLLLAGFFGGLVGPQIVSRSSEPHPYLGKLSAYATAPLPPVAREIMRYAHPGESLGQWGWMCRYYVLTGMRQATRIAHTNQEIQYSPQIEFYRAQYLADLARNQPPVFIDTVGPGNFVFQTRDSAHESLPALRDYIDQHYHLVADTDGTRIYVRIDRLARP